MAEKEGWKVVDGCEGFNKQLDGHLFEPSSHNA